MGGRVLGRVVRSRYRFVGKVDLTGLSRKQGPGGSNPTKAPPGAPDLARSFQSNALTSQGPITSAPASMGSRCDSPEKQKSDARGAGR